MTWGFEENSAVVKLDRVMSVDASTIPARRMDAILIGLIASHLLKSSESGCLTLLCPCRPLGNFEA